MESASLEDGEVESWFVPIMDVVDDKTDVRISLVETCFTGLAMENRLMVRVRVPWVNNRYHQRANDDDDDGKGAFVVLKDDMAMREVSAMGRIAGDERWIIGQNERMELVVLRF